MPRHDILDDYEFEDEQFDPETGHGEVVAKFYSPMEAEVSAARLRAEGIPCFLANSASQSVLTSTMVMVRLHVRPQDIDRAREILQDEMPAPEGKSGSIFTGLLIILGIFLALWAIIMGIRLLMGQL